MRKLKRTLGLALDRGYLFHKLPVYTLSHSQAIDSEGVYHLPIIFPLSKHVFFTKTCNPWWFQEKVRSCFVLLTLLCTIEVCEWQTVSKFYKN